MSSEYKTTITKLYVELDELLLKVADIKKTINMLSTLSGEKEPFEDIGTPSLSSRLSLRNDLFFGKSFASAAKEFLRLKGQACTAEEILKGLEDGGFEFSKNWKANLKLKNTAISLGKNSNDFVYVKSSNAYGLWEFYPEKLKERERKKGLSSVSGNDDAVEKMIDDKLEEQK